MWTEIDESNELDVTFQFFGYWNSGRIGDALSLLSDTVTYDRVPLAAVRGRREVESLLRGFGIGASFTVAWQITNFAISRNVVFTERVDVYRHECGGAIVVPVMGALTVVHDEITSWRDYFDHASFDEQLAAIHRRTDGRSRP
ncbi:limonene-1,2-epoxide hydrolase [Luteibacter sp. W1I16]|uniref:limonene-1,2-epoxide hydrolase family protein n=1 Tax=Luteibacter sp. W1I16 TaxID=3373922 RepID=UPI003D23C2C8